MAASTHLKAEAANTRSVAFKCHAPTAQQVCVAGTFNEWKHDAAPLVRDKAGNWRGSLILLRGRYEFKFLVECQWGCAPGCEKRPRDCAKCVPNEFGTMNRVLEVR